MPRLPLSLLLVLAWSCGRDEVFLLGNGEDGDGGRRSDGFVPGTDGPFIPDDGPFDIPDVGSRDRAFLDGGQECNIPRDCRVRYGPPPPCPDGRQSTWQCSFEGFCEIECGPSMCTNDCDCPSDVACLGGVCQPAGRRNLCCTNPRCPPGEFCIEPGGGPGICEEARPDAGIPDAGRRDGGIFDAGRPDAGRPDTGIMETPVGDPCASQLMCGPFGFCITEDQGFPDGYCTQDCGNSPNGRPCPAGSGCRSFGPGTSFCLDNCSSNPDCRSEYLCIQLGLDPQRVCWPNPGGSTNPNGNPVGGECSGDEDCQTGLLCLDFAGWPGGYCTKQFCDPMTNPCPMGSACFNFPQFPSICLDSCPNGGTTSDCRPDYYCFGPTGQPGGCVPN